jgi:lipopolysaccharide/colanic/teichoic acid biosynthesis glycosyltransferase
MLIKTNYFLSIFKPVIDYTIATFGLVLTSPILLLLAIAIKMSGKGPVIYTQMRIGKHGKPFTLYKLRSLYEGTNDGMPLLSGKDDSRITKVGRFMRKHKLDEIPNFINILKGEMSLVGPRPEQQYFIDQIVARVPQYIYFQNIKPGVTSWGQVKYGYASNVDEMIDRLSYDIFYLENRSLWFDLKVALYTVGIIIKGQGV